MIIVAVSGGFDPIHVGHLRSIQEARELGDSVMVILTRDDQLIMKKGYVFMPYHERKEILMRISGVDMVLPNIDPDLSSTQSLERYSPDIFAKGGDRTEDNMPPSEKEICQKIGCKIVYGVGGNKIQSSSWLVNKSSDQKKKVLTRTAWATT
jgi:D-beta-D-heptose 7-phosphate kinase/D-beta-D-heptose 1-phosphate adenosyltransferase